MKVIVAGSRWIYDRETVYAAIVDSGFQITEIVSGGNRGKDRDGNQIGVDGFGEDWAEMFKIPTRIFPPDWALYGKAAGPKRNREMAEYADALKLVWDGESKGSKSMLREAKSLDLPIHEVLVKNV